MTGAGGVNNAVADDEVVVGVVDEDGITRARSSIVVETVTADDVVVGA